MAHQPNMYRNTRRLAGAGLLLAGTAWAGLAAAQVTPPEAAAPQNTAPATTTAAAPVATTDPVALDTTGIADVVVTAERRESTIQRTPIAILAVGGDTLTKAGVSNARDLAQLVPSLELRQNTGSGVAIFIRGVGTENRTIGSDPSNVFTLDGIALNNRSGPDTLFYDVDRVEVLKGPQGTLYGRNAVGGAVNLLTRDPQLGEFGGYGIAGYGNYDAIKAEGAINLPLGDTLAIRIAGNHVSHDGYLNHGSFSQQGEPKDHASDQHNTAGRVKLLWEPSDAVRLVLNGEYAISRGRGPGYVVNGPTNNTDAGGVLDPQNLRGRFINRDPWLDPCSDQVRNFVFGVTENATQVGARCNGFIDQDTWALGANLQVDLGFAKWTTLANVRRTIDDYRYYFRWDSVTTTGRATEKTLETRLASTGGGPFTWVTGLYVFDEGGSQIDWSELNTALYSATVKPDNSATSFGVFGQATYALTPSFRVTGGLRYSHDKKSFENLVIQNVPTEYALPAATALRVNNEATFSKVNYRAALEYDVAPANLLYASISSGYHAGGLAPGDPTGPYLSRYEPEELTAYAIGSKNRFFDNRFQLNAEVFYWKYDNLLFTTRGFVNCASCAAAPTVPPTPAGATIALATYNAGRAYIYGADVDFVARPASNTTFSGNLYWNKSKYQDFAISPLNAALNARGRRLANVPAFQASATLQQDFPFASGARVSAAARYRLLGQVWTGPSHNVPGSFLGERHTADFDLSYTTANTGLTFTGYVRNIFDAANILGGSGNGGDREPATGSLWGSIAPPRTYGVQVQFKF